MNENKRKERNGMSDITATPPSAAGTAVPYSRSVAKAMLEQLRLWGVRRVYGVTGDAIFGLMDALADQDQIAFIAVKHESAAALMASAEAKLTGGLGVCVAQTGPGLANLIVGLGDAYLDNAPVLAITGQSPLAKIGTPAKQFIDQQVLMQAVAGYSRLVADPDAAMAGLTEAMHRARANLTVSHLSVPADLFGLSTAVPAKQPPAPPVAQPDTEALDQAAGMMRAARRPMMLAGCGLRHERDSLLKLAEAWGCGLALAYGATGIVPDDHPLLLNGLGEGGNPHLDELFRQADAVLVLESDWWPEGSVPQGARVIRTASHPALLGLSRPAETAIVGDGSMVLKQLIERMNGHPANPSWPEAIRRCKRAWQARREREAGSRESPLHPAGIVQAVGRALDEDAVIALDEGDSTLWFLRCFRARKQRVLLSNRFRTMGFGLPAAIAAKLCRPEQQVVCLTGDGGLGMVMAELLTAARYELAIGVIAFRNDSLQMERDKTAGQGLRPKGTELTNPDFVRVAEACGWAARRVASLRQLEEALEHYLGGSRPFLLEADTARVPFPEFQS
ncbi:thiamine pyrophosphate-binding protein [Paenibacillus sp. GCM10023250]|uniref:thiamine pyrophosphate-binding protein n=1 Tax=Paenibacillus sp. GCM10023250 TaxID=3252648 RepID=UPI00361F031A